MSAPDLTAVVVSWNSARFLDGCLGSLLDQRGPVVETIVVDNGSTDGSQSLVRERFPNATLIEAGTNLGFCAANNLGLAGSRAPFVLFLNPDVVLEQGFVERSLQPFARDPKIGIVGGKLLRFDRRTIDSAGQFLTRSRKALERGYGDPDGPDMDGEGYVFSICGAAMVCRKEMIEDISVGGSFFDPVYFAFSEDLDVGWRARLAGWRAWYAPAAVGYHYRGGTEGGAEGSRSALPALLRRPRHLRAHILKNRWLTLIKNDALSTFLRDLPFILPRHLAMLAAAVVTTPAIIADLTRTRGLYGEARKRRREFLAKEGRWGRRTAGAPSRWVRWSAPTPLDGGPA